MVRRIHIGLGLLDVHPCFGKGIAANRGAAVSGVADRTVPALGGKLRCGATYLLGNLRSD